jgi:hypothetical protein
MVTLIVKYNRRCKPPHDPTNLVPFNILKHVPVDIKHELGLDSYPLRTYSMNKNDKLNAIKMFTLDVIVGSKSLCVTLYGTSRISSTE